MRLMHFTSRNNLKHVNFWALRRYISMKVPQYYNRNEIWEPTMR